jgi:hypothetical protein
VKASWSTLDRSSSFPAAHRSCAPSLPAPPAPARPSVLAAGSPARLSLSSTRHDPHHPCAAAAGSLLPGSSRQGCVDCLLLSLLANPALLACTSPTC